MCACRWRTADVCNPRHDRVYPCPLHLCIGRNPRQSSAHGVVPIPCCLCLTAISAASEPVVQAPGGRPASLRREMQLHHAESPYSGEGASSANEAPSRACMWHFGLGIGPRGLTSQRPDDSLEAAAAGHCESGSQPASQPASCSAACPFFAACRPVGSEYARSCTLVGTCSIAQLRIWDHRKSLPSPNVICDRVLPGGTSWLEHMTTPDCRLPGGRAGRERERVRERQRQNGRRDIHASLPTVFGSRDRHNAGITTRPRPFPDGTTASESNAAQP